MELQTNVKSGEVKISENSTSVVTKEPIVTKEPDLVTRVSQVKVEPEVKPTEVKEPEFDFKEIDKITDPAAKEYAEKAYKSFQRGFNQKFQELAEIRKTYETKTAETSNWTPERVQQLLNDGTFVNAAKSVMATQAPSTFEGTQEDWSGLSDTDKAKFHQLENKINFLEQQNFQTKRVQEDESLKTKYVNYKPEAIDILTADLLANKVQATREHLWKVYDYDDAVRRAYELGKEDRQLETTEKKSSTSVEGLTTTSSKEIPTPEKNESNRAFWNRIVLSNLTRLKEGQIRK
jgi:hypothetical protein